jgi:hypothetical protein
MRRSQVSGCDNLKNGGSRGGRTPYGSMTYNEAKCEPGVGLDDVPGIVAAVEALERSMVAFHLLAEGVLATGEDDAHGGG